MLFDTLYETAKAGGWVLIPIFLVGVLGFFLLLSKLNHIGRDFFRHDFRRFIHQFQILLNQGSMEETQKYLKMQRGLVSRQLQLALEHPEWSEHRIKVHMQQRAVDMLFQLDQGIHFATVLAATAPLLGLLGTVSGMVSTFEVITLYGNSNPVLMADGISEALITTQSGLLIAFPMVLLLRRIEERTNWIKKQMQLGMTVILNWSHARHQEIQS